ncbi:MAG: tetratricopeptide repeat protein, partial [Phycisphaerae bacterium]
MPIMLRNGKATTLTLAALFTAGCAKSDYVVSHARREHWQGVKRGEVANAPEVVPPKILPETYFAAGRLFEVQGLVGKAVAQYRKAVAVNHDYAEAFDRLGVLLGTVGRHKEALEAFNRAVELRPDDAIIRNNLGFEFVLQRRWQDAERELRTAITLDPEFARARVNMGIVEGRLKRFDQALEHFRSVLPEPDAYYNLALLLRSQQRYNEAVEALEHTLCLAPHFTAASVQLERLAEQGKPEPTATEAVLVEALGEGVVVPPTPDVVALSEEQEIEGEAMPAGGRQEEEPGEEASADLDITAILEEVERVMADRGWAMPTEHESSAPMPAADEAEITDGTAVSADAGNAQETHGPDTSLEGTEPAAVEQEPVEADFTFFDEFFANDHSEMPVDDSLFAYWLSPASDVPGVVDRPVET